MATKWQTGAISSVGIGFLLAIILTLSGMSYSHDGDKFCTDCYSEIKVNSTYWNVCVEHANDKTAVFKKSTYGRTLWINLDAIDEIVSTNPKVHVELLVPTIKSRAEYITEYGYLRNVKDGDCIIERSRKPSKIYLHGKKEAWQTVKWSFDIEHWQSDDINIDPIWQGNGIEVIQDCKTTTQEYEYPTYLKYTEYHNSSSCIDAPINKTCFTSKAFERNISYKSGSYIHYSNSTTCKDTAVSVNGKIINFSKYNWKGYQIIGNKVCFEAQHKSNGNGICEDGESYNIYDSSANIVSNVKNNQVLKVEK